MRAATSISRESDTRTATEAAVVGCFERLGGSSEVFAGLVFVGADHDQAVVSATLAERLHGVPFIGASTDGEITEQGLGLDSICVMLMSSPNVRARTTLVRDLSTDSEQAGREVARRLQSESAKALILLPDGLTGNGSAIIRGALEILGDSFVIAGGTAGDRGRFVKTWQICNGEVTSDALAALMLESDKSLEVGFGVMSGWKPMGIAKEVSKAEGNVVHQIEGETALDVYSRFLGDKASQLPAIGVEYPFALVDNYGYVDTQGIRDGEDYLLLRAPMSVDRTTGAVSFAAEIPQGAKVKMTRAKSTDIIAASREAARRSVAALTGTPDVVMFFSCMARKVVLGRRTQEEIEVAQEVFGPNVPMIGFYTYGEIANCGERLPVCRFHNETATFLTLREG